jgi:hypothetical protein
MKTRAALAAAYLASIVAAAFAVTHVGHQYGPGQPHVLPVWPGIEAPSGVYLIGVTLVLRDLLQRRAGKAVTFGLMLVGAGLAAIFSPAVAIASAVALIVSETVDLGIFTAVERFGIVRAVLASNTVSIVVDSWLFLTIAFGSAAFIEGQVIGKALATIAVVLVLVALRFRRSAVTA